MRFNERSSICCLHCWYYNISHKTCMHLYGMLVLYLMRIYMIYLSAILYQHMNIFGVAVKLTTHRGIMLQICSHFGPHSNWVFVYRHCFKRAGISVLRSVYINQKTSLYFETKSSSSRNTNFFANDGPLNIPYFLNCVWYDWHTICLIMIGDAPFMLFDRMGCMYTLLCINALHYNDVIMGAIASQITSLTIVYPTFFSGANQRKHQSPASLAFVRGIHRGPVNSLRKWPVTRKMLPFDDVIMTIGCIYTLVCIYALV